MPYVVTTLAGSSAGGAAPPSTMSRKAGGIDPPQRGRDQRDEGGAGRRRLLHGVRVEAGLHQQGRAGDDGTRDDGESADVRERQARQPRVARRIDPEPSAGGDGRCAHGVMGEDDPFRFAGRAARRDDERVAVVDGLVRVASRPAAVRPPAEEGGDRWATPRRRRPRHGAAHRRSPVRREGRSGRGGARRQHCTDSSCHRGQRQTRTP